MAIDRSAHHRGNHRADPMHDWRKRFSYRIGLLCSVARALHAILAIDWPGAPLAVQAQRLRAKVVLEKAWPLVIDEDGSRWE